MYKIIGADGKEYGPITADQLRQWIAEGRVNTQTKILAEGAAEWRQLADFPDFASAVSTPPPPPTLQGIPGTPMPPSGGNASQVEGPAIGLIIVAVLYIIGGILSLLIRFVGMSFLANSQLPTDAVAAMMAGGIGIALNAVVFVIALIILLGGLKMRKLENYGLAMAASILAMLPCSFCCIIGLPIGIWALVILSKPEVKAAFH